MADDAHDDRSRFLFLVTWRREKELPESGEVWRGSIKVLAPDEGPVAGASRLRWFRRLEDLPLILRKILGGPDEADQAGRPAKPE